MGNEMDINDLILEYVKTNDEKIITKIIEIIKSSTVREINCIVDNNDYLFCKDEKGYYLIDYIIANGVNMSKEYRANICKDARVVLKFIQKMAYYNIFYLSEDILFSELSPGMGLLIDYLFKMDEIVDTHILAIKNHREIIDYIKKYNRLDLLYYLDENFLFEKFDDNKTIIDYLFENTNVNKELLGRISHHTEIYDLLIKNNKQNLLRHIPESVFNTKLPNKDITLLEELIVSNKEINTKLESEESFNTVIKHKRYDLLVNFSEDKLLRKVEGNKTALELMLEKDVITKLEELKEKESLNIIYRMKKFDVMTKFSVKDLLSVVRNTDTNSNTSTDLNTDLNSTYLDVMLEEFKKQPGSYRLSKLKIFDISSNKTLARIYMMIAQKGLIRVVSEPSAQRLMKVDNDGNRLIDELLELNEELTKTEFLTKTVLKDMDLYLYLRVKGYKNDGLIFDVDDTADLISNYFDRRSAELDNIQGSDEIEALLNKFREKMLADGKSNPKMVEFMIKGYRKAASSGNINIVTEIQRLIEMKENNPEFHLKNNKYLSSCYVPDYKRINLDQQTLRALYHETGHAMFDMLADQKLPTNYEAIVSKIRNNPEVVGKIAKLTGDFLSMKEKLEKIVEEEYFSNYEESISPERKQEIEEFLREVKIDKFNFFKGLGYNEKELEACIGELFTYETYIEMEKRTKIEELTQIILGEEYPELDIISDIIDSIYEGRYFDELLTDKDGKKIKCFAGHGVEYYVERGLEIQFDENIANIVNILKYPNVNEILSRLKEIVGEEFVNMMVNYYQENIVNSRKYESERSM